MGRKKITEKAEVVRLNSSKRYDHPVWDEEAGRTVWKSTGETDKGRAEAFHRHHLETEQWKTLRGYDMTLDAAFQHFFEGNAHFLAIDEKRRRYNEYKHILGHYRIADPEFPKAVDQFILDLLAGKPVRRFARDDKRTMNSVRAKLHPNTIAILRADIVATINYVSKKKVGGEPLFPRQLVPVFEKVDKSSAPPPRKTNDLYFTDQEVILLFNGAVEQMRQRGETRFSIEYRAMAVMLYCGGQRGERVAFVPWSNFKLDVENPIVDFSEVASLRYTPRKKGKKDMPIPPEFLPLLKQFWNQKIGPYFLDRQISQAALAARLKRLYTAVLGIKYGGTHAWRKTYFNKAIATGQRDHVCDLMAITTVTGNKYYAKQDPARDRTAAARIGSWGDLPGAPPPLLPHRPMLLLPAPETEPVKAPDAKPARKGRDKP